MGWTLLYMLVILKIPLVAALILIWYAVKAEPSPEEEPLGGGGPRRDPLPRPPRPRRGPAGGACRPVPCSQTVPIRLGRPAPLYVRR